MKHFKKSALCAALLAAVCSACGAVPTDESAAENGASESVQATTTETEARSTLGGQAPFGYLWAGGDANFPANTKGASAKVRVAKPIVKKSVGGSEPAHSLAEIAGMDQAAKNKVEIGWIVYDNDPTPKLFVFYWVNGDGKCGRGTPPYNCTSFVSTSTTIQQGMSLTPGTTLDLRIVHVDAAPANGWHFYYGTTDFGYLPDSLWGTIPFTTLAGAKFFGEVLGDVNGLGFCSEMGNGRYGSDPAAELFSTAEYTVAGQSPTPAGLILNVTDASKYSAAFATQLTRAPLRYGGPYQGGARCPALPPVGCVKKPRCCGGTVCVCDSQSCPVVCPPPNQ